MQYEKLVEILKNNLCKILGGIFGLILSIIILNFGILKTIFIVILVCIGILIGTKLDKKESLKQILNNIFATDRFR